LSRSERRQPRLPRCPMFMRWWRTRAGSPAQQMRRERRRFQPRLELLEDRRLLSAGGFDPTFGQNGVSPTDPDATAKALRIEGDGALDDHFGSDGIVTLDTGGSEVAGGIALQGDGKIVVSGQNGSELALWRCNSDGSLDTTFGFNGNVNVSLGSPIFAGSRVA